MSARPNQIPPEAVEAVARVLCVEYCSEYDADPEIMWRYFTDEASAAIAAALAAWPGATYAKWRDYGEKDRFVLPLEPET